MIDYSQQFQQGESNHLSEMQEDPPLTTMIVPHNPQQNSPIEKAISSLRYSSIPYFMFESHSSKSNNSHSRKCVVRRSEDGWFEDLEDNIWKGPTRMALASETIAGNGHIHSSQPEILEIDSDTDSSRSSSLAPSTTDPESETEELLHITEDVVGGCQEGLDDAESKISRNSEAQYVTKDLTVPPALKGMARLRRISPRAIKTGMLQC